ncbi:flagellar basal body P-ring formation chaperone FlgA [Sphingomonas sp. BN140010]|uniref:Flagella basal body P-ring formation protein FlgA n=1 Tax=Sphingomonas arvum TaxID=2992113 RepID=A0ABT3JDL2_9SPHN|nr:flagellar basal body P-ring formation chaperone FlgA [Sphingomonas sp. BN140010]MCW3797163.1 flagellar basal body P-ring formation chaperone FlgA [Sphingomonas sp. BN140010]
MLALALLALAEIPVLAHDVQRGDILSAADFVLEERAGPLPPLARPDQILGQEALRRLPAGTLVRANDVAEPRLVKRGEPVTLVIASGNLRITAAGRALGDGRSGDSVRVVASATTRTLDGTVIAVGTVTLATP